MLTIQQNISLLPYNTFHCYANAKFFCHISTIQDLKDAVTWADEHKKQILILGGGSNIIFTQDFDGLVIKMEIKGIQKVSEKNQRVILKVGAGENWHHFVQYTVDKSWSGIENLSLIPGTVGASPIQNIGAYGVEAKDVIESVEVYDLIDHTIKTIENKDCHFNYRDSIFKQNKNRYIVVAVVFKLSHDTQLHLEYGAIREELHKRNIKTPNLKDVANAIIAIRQSKLPDPNIIGNAGSFFKNPIVDSTQHERLLHSFPNIVTYPIDNNYFKVSAGWLIENAGYKGKNDGKVGTFNKQALVLINFNNATGKDVLYFSEEIINIVQKKYDLTLEREVNIF